MPPWEGVEVGKAERPLMMLLTFRRELVGPRILLMGEQEAKLSDGFSDQMDRR